MHSKNKAPVPLPASSRFVPFGAVTQEHFDKLFNINVRGALFTVQKALPLLNDGGSIILNGSVASVKGYCRLRRLRRE